MTQRQDNHVFHLHTAGKLVHPLLLVDAEKVQAAIEATRTMPGIGYVRVWLASGELTVGDDIMLVLIGGDIRPHVVDALQSLVGTIKNECVSEVEREA